MGKKSNHKHDYETVEVEDIWFTHHVICKICGHVYNRIRKEEKEIKKEVYSNCYKCGDDLVEGQVIIAVHQYFYCSGKCLEGDKKAIMLGDGK